MAKATGDDIKIGNILWYAAMNAINGHIPLAIKIVGDIETHAHNIQLVKITPINTIPNRTIISTTHYEEDNHYCIYLGDAGVKPYNYDNRETQVFTNEQDCIDAIKSWNGFNPNFIK